MDSVTLSKTAEDSPFDVSKCIICQEHTADKTVSTDDGRKRIREASDIHNDNVSKRLKVIEGDEFVYHMTNECYKKYTMKSVRDRLGKKNLAQLPDPSSSQINEADRRGHAVRSPPNTEPTATALRDVNCIICGNKSYKQQYKKISHQ